MPKQMTPHSTFYKMHILVGVRLALPLPTCFFFGTTFLFNSFVPSVCSLQNPMRLCYIDSSFHESRYMMNIISWLRLKCFVLLYLALLHFYDPFSIKRPLYSTFSASVVFCFLPLTTIYWNTKPSSYNQLSYKLQTRFSNQFLWHRVFCKEKYYNSVKHYGS